MSKMGLKIESLMRVGHAATPGAEQRINILFLREVMWAEANELMVLEHAASITDMSESRRAWADNQLRVLRANWGQAHHIKQIFEDASPEWESKETAPTLSISDPIVTRITSLSGAKFPLIWMLVESNNRDVAMNYNLDEYVGKDPKWWEGFRKKSETPCPYPLL